MSHHRYSTPEASQALGIPVHVITYWLGQIPYPAEQDAQGQWRLTPEAMGVLQAVKGLKERNASMEEIRKHVRALQEAMPVRSVPGAVTFVAPEAPAVPDDRAWGIPAGPTARPRVSAKPPVALAAQVPAASAVAAAPAPTQAPANPKPKAPAPLPAQAVVPAASDVPAPPGDALASITVMAQRYAHAAHQIGRLEAENEHLKANLARTNRDADDAKCRIAELEAAANKPKARSRWWAWLAMGALL